MTGVINQRLLKLAEVKISQLSYCATLAKLLADAETSFQFIYPKKSS